MSETDWWKANWEIVGFNQLLLVPLPLVTEPFPILAMVLLRLEQHILTSVISFLI